MRLLRQQKVYTNEENKLASAGITDLYWHKSIGDGMQLKHIYTYTHAQMQSNHLKSHQ